MVNKGKGNSKVGGVGGGDDTDKDAIANGSESQQVARTDDGRGGGGGNGEDGLFIQRTEDESSVRVSLEEFSSPPSSSSGAGMDIRTTDDNNHNVDLSMAMAGPTLQGGVEDSAIIDLKKARARESKAQSCANQTDAHRAAKKKGTAMPGQGGGTTPRRSRVSRCTPCNVSA